MILSLPPEVVDLVVGLLPPRDLESVRLVCRALREVGGRALLEEVVLCYSKKLFTKAMGNR